jgi:nucleotide-binding universal stress UspA family protein
MKRILFAVGETEATLHVARQIRPWLRERETSLTLLAVVESSSLSPLSPARQILEQTEAIFTGAAEQPGILLRVGSDPAAEICREMSLGKYGLLAMGTHDYPALDAAPGTTCRAVLRACHAPLFVTSHTLGTKVTRQILIVATHTGALSKIIDWLISQCQAQKLSAILCARSASASEPIYTQFVRARIRAQTLISPDLSAAGIDAVSRDRRVRWIVWPVSPETSDASADPAIRHLLSKAHCPVLLVPDSAD